MAGEISMLTIFSSFNARVHVHVELCITVVECTSFLTKNIYPRGPKLGPSYFKSPDSSQICHCILIHFHSFQIIIRNSIFNSFQIFMSRR